MGLTGQTSVIGFTGAFGSGCSEAARHLHHERGYELVRLSEPIRTEWRQRNSDAKAQRNDLQGLGDELRRAHGADYLVQEAIKRADGLTEDVDRLVVDSIRNLAEVDALRDRFGYRFTLIAVLATVDDRWSRIGDAEYRDNQLDEDAFLDDDDRDRNEEMEHGQQVELCVDTADVFIDNTKNVGLEEFHTKVIEFADLVAGASPRPPTHDENFMHAAYTTSHMSRCLKRHVGAVLVVRDEEVIAWGFNENPTGTKPCVDEPDYKGRCYRDIVRNQLLAAYSEQQMKCPVCGEVLPVVAGPPWRCPSCEQKGVKTDLDKPLFPDRAMNWCTAIHAEDRAIFSAGPRARGAVLYSTTFPCFQCADKVAHAGIDRVVFTEVYPDVRAADRLDLAGVTYRQFEGVRSSAFERIFGPLAPK